MTNTTPAPQLVQVSPEIAKKWLEKNTLNRPIRTGKVKDIANDIINGRWLTTHQGIALAADGRVVDGQHRLKAIERSGKTVSIWVTFNADPETFAKIDNGTLRTEGDILSILTINKAKTAAAIARAATRGVTFEHGSPDVRQAYAIAHDGIIQLMMPVSKMYGAQVAGAFVRAIIAQYSGAADAAVRICDLDWAKSNRSTVTHRTLVKRLHEMKGGGHKLSQERYCVTVSALKAIRDQRDLQVLRASEKDID